MIGVYRVGDPFPLAPILGVEQKVIQASDESSRSFAEMDGPKKAIGRSLPPR